MKRLTIFTPTYNREKELPALYESLLLQQTDELVWLIIDDGSTDQTESLVKNWIDNKKMDIRYYRQENRGKHIALNMGALLTETELFLCVDSDDVLAPGAAVEILRLWDGTEKTPDICGIIGLQHMSHVGNVAETVRKWPKTVPKGTLAQLYTRDGFRGETNIVLRTEVLGRFPFPQLGEERFLHESVLYEKIDADYQYIYTEKIFCTGTYLKSGLSSNMSKIRHRNPIGLAYSYKHTAAYHYNFMKRARSYAFYIGMKRLYGVRDTFNTLKVSFWCKAAAFLLLRLRYNKHLKNWKMAED